jgi:hypothetical protein
VRRISHRLTLNFLLCGEGVFDLLGVGAVHPGGGFGITVDRGLETRTDSQHRRRRRPHGSHLGGTLLKSQNSSSARPRGRGGPTA